jgi:hypothetical protein
MTTTDWFSNIISTLFLIGSAAAVLKNNWCQARPVFSTYISLLAIPAPLLMVLYLIQSHPSQIQYTACRVYGAVYPIIQLLIYFLAIAVLYEFLFHMAGNKKAIRKVAVIGFAMTMGLTIYVAYKLMMPMPHTSNRLLDAATFFGRVTALSLLISGLFVFAIKSAQSLHLETKLAIVLGAIAFFDFIQMLIAFMMRGHTQIAAIASQVISISFAILLYVAVRNGPALANRTSAATISQT